MLEKKRNCTICVAKIKALISCAVSAHLLCGFVFSFFFFFSHDATHLSNLLDQNHSPFKENIHLK